MTATRRSDLARELAEGHGNNEVELPDGRLIRLCVESDDDFSINDFDCYGKVEPVRPSSWSIFMEPRPDGFDGAAEKIDTRDGAYWWQPPLDEDGIPRRDWHADADLRRTTRRQVSDLLEYGFSVYVVEVCEGTDAYGRPIVTDMRSVGAVEPFADDEYRTELVADLLTELGFDDCENDTGGSLLCSCDNNPESCPIHTDTE